MHIRQATDEDIPRIISLLKKSLGEAIPKSETYWNWKHQNNPFGKSYVLLTEENTDLTIQRLRYLCFFFQCFMSLNCFNR